jgi:hypothetical protein
MNRPGGEARFDYRAHLFLLECGRTGGYRYSSEMRPMTSEKQRMEESLAGDHEAESLFDGDLKPFIQAVLWKRCSDERSRRQACERNLNRDFE